MFEEIYYLIFKINHSKSSQEYIFGLIFYQVCSRFAHCSFNHNIQTNYGYNDKMNAKTSDDTRKGNR